MILDGKIQLQDELAYTKLLAGVPRNSKSSLLWHHRRWILERLFPANAAQVHDSEWPAEMPIHACEEELSLAARACQSYPRNYPAWSHRSFVLRHMRNRSLVEVDPGWRTLLVQEYKSMTSWLESHISDYSAVGYLCQLQRVMQGLDLSAMDQAVQPSTSLAAHAIDYFLDLIRRYPDHEGLWLGVRTNVASLGRVPSDLEGAEVLKQILLDDGSEASSEAEQAPGRLYALRFWFWHLEQEGTISFTTESVRAVLSSYTAPAIAKQVRRLSQSINESGV